jgi:hypothetical protein
MPNWLISFDLGKGCLDQGNPFSFPLCLPPWRASLADHLAL